MPSNAELERRASLYPAGHYGSNPALVKSDLLRYMQTHSLYFIVPGVFALFGVVCAVLLHWSLGIVSLLGLSALVIVLKSSRRQPIIGQLRPAIVVRESPLTYAVYEDWIWGQDKPGSISKIAATSRNCREYKTCDLFALLDVSRIRLRCSSTS